MITWYHTCSAEYAWEQCYRYFQVRDAEFDGEIACLRLVSYLASWGMYRGSSKIRNHSHFQLLECVKEVREWQGKRRCDNHICTSVSAPSLDELFKSIKKSIDKKVTATPTLVTKIAHGTVCEFPALDRYVVKHLRSQNCNVNLSIQSIQEILDAANATTKTGSHRSEMKGGDFPRMRAIDRIWMQAGIAAADDPSKSRP